MLDRALFRLINTTHSPFWDGVLVFVSRRESWFSAYILLILGLIQLYRRRAVLLIPLIGATVGLADAISSQAFKPFTRRLRPCHEPALSATLRLVDGYGCGGQFGFMSSHAANTLALAVFLGLTLPRRFRWFKWVLGAWVLLTGYSRVYLGAHYPGDVVAGWALGALLGWGGARLFGALNARWPPQPSARAGS